MKKIVSLLIAFILITGVCFFNPVVKKAYAEGEKKIILKGIVNGKGSPNFLEGANWVNVSGNYAYVVSYDDNSLSVFDISDPSNPALASSVKVQAYESKDYGAFSVFVSGNFAYVYDDGGVFLVYDVSDPTGEGPVLQGKVKIGPTENFEDADSAWGGVYVEGILAYVVDEVSDGLNIIDVSDKTNPSIIGTISGAGAPNYLKDPCYVTVNDGFAFIASRTDDSLTIIDVELPKKPALTAVIKGAGEPNYLDRISSVFIANDYAYTVSYNDAALSIIDVINPQVPVISGYISGKGKPNYLEGAIDVIVANDYAFVASAVDKAISVYDVIDVADPVLVDVIKGSGSPNFLDGVNTLDISGSYLYATSSHDNALMVFDISGFITDGDGEGNIPESVDPEDETGAIDNSGVSILRQWLRIHNPNSI